MLKGSKKSIFIAYGLGLVYGLSAIFYWAARGDSPALNHSLVISILFLALFFSALAASRLQEWGRQLLVIISTGMCLYLIFLFTKYPNFVQPSYIFIHLAVVLFFNQRKVKVHFQPTLALTRKSVLVVDDDEGLIKTIKKLLLSHGYSVLAATTGERGIQVAKAQKPDVIVLDVLLPGIKGRDVCAQLKQEEETRNIPVIFLTAKDSEDDKKAEQEAGGTTHLTKPFNARIFLAEIRKAIG